MSIVSSSHTPQGRGEEKGANYKGPNPALPDFSSSGIGPPIPFGTSHPSAGSALSGDPPRLLGAPRCHEVRGEEARSRPPAGLPRRRPAPRAAAAPRELPASRPPPPEATEPGLPRFRQYSRTAQTYGAFPSPGEEPCGAAPFVRFWVPGVRGVRRLRLSNARRPGGARGEVALACASINPAVKRGARRLFPAVSRACSSPPPPVRILALLWLTP